MNFILLQLGSTGHFEIRNFESYILIIWIPESTCNFAIYFTFALGDFVNFILLQLGSIVGLTKWKEYCSNSDNIDLASLVNVAANKKISLKYRLFANE